MRFVPSFYLGARPLSRPGKDHSGGLVLAAAGALALHRPTQVGLVGRPAGRRLRRLDVVPEGHTGLGQRELAVEDLEDLVGPPVRDEVADVRPPQVLHLEEPPDDHLVAVLVRLLAGVDLARVAVALERVLGRLRRRLLGGRPLLGRPRLRRGGDLEEGLTLLVDRRRDGGRPEALLGLGDGHRDHRGAELLADLLPQQAGLVGQRLREEDVGPAAVLRHDEAEVAVDHAVKVLDGAGDGGDGGQGDGGGHDSLQLSD